MVGTGTGTSIREHSQVDVAYIKLKPEIAELLRRAGSKFISINQIRGHLHLRDEADYCVFGYPVINKRLENEDLKTTGSAYFLRPSTSKVLEYYGFEPMAQYVLEFNGRAVNIKTGVYEKVKTEHYGLSGCGLWLINIQHDGASFSSEAKLIGIMTEFRRGKYDCLIGNRIEIILISLQDHEGLKFKGKTTDPSLKAKINIK